MAEDKDGAAQAEALKLSRVRRDEEWQKVRNPDVITEKDKEEDFETKTLYERLQENRELKRQEIEEQFRYKNMVYSGLDNDEHKFLEAWENSKQEEISQRNKMEIEELHKFKARIVDLEANTNPSELLAAPLVKAPSDAVNRQKKLMVGAVKRKKVDRKKAATPPPPPSGGLLGLGAYSDSEEEEKEEEEKEKKPETNNKSNSSSSGSISSSSSSSSESDSSSSSDGSNTKRKRRKRKVSWESTRVNKD